MFILLKPGDVRPVGLLDPPRVGGMPDKSKLVFDIGQHRGAWAAVS